MWLNCTNYHEYLKGRTVVEISGDGCANCLSLMPILNRLVCKLNGVKIYHIEACEDTIALLQMFKIVAFPTILVLKDLKVIASCHGYQPEEILELWLQDKLNL